MFSGQWWVFSGQWGCFRVSGGCFRVRGCFQAGGLGFCFVLFKPSCCYNCWASVRRAGSAGQCGCLCLGEKHFCLVIIATGEQVA